MMALNRGLVVWAQKKVLALKTSSTSTVNFSTSCFLNDIQHHYQPHKTHYEILGIPRTATQKEIKTAYVKLSKKFHPDRIVSSSSHESARFIAIHNAYSVLSKPKKRHIYDLGLHKEDQEETQTRQAYQTDQRNGPYRTATFDDRKAFYGFPETDRNYYKTNRGHHFVALGCVIFTLIGFLLHGAIVALMYQRHNEAMAKQTERLSQVHLVAVEEAKRHGTIESQLKAFEERRRKNQIRLSNEVSQDEQ